MNKISPQTKSFIIIFSLAIFGTYLCLALWSNSGGPDGNGPTVINYIQKTNTQSAAGQPVATAPQVATTGWKTYTDKQNGFSFLYNPNWKILAAKNVAGFTVLQIDPGTKYYNIKIYISPKEFYIMDGLPTKQETIDNQPTLNVFNALYGIKASNLYYTFDVGLSMSLVPEFDALVHSVKFE